MATVDFLTSMDNINWVAQGLKYLSKDTDVSEVGGLRNNKHEHKTATKEA